MSFKKNVLILSVFLMSAGASAQTYSDVARASQPQQGTLKTGDAIWVNNLCKRISEAGDLELVSPIGVAITTCARKRDYAKIEEAYAKLEVQNCSDINLKESNVGTICETARGGQFKKVANGIQDMTSGLVVMNEIKSRVNQYEATNYCSAKGQRLPTREEFIALEQRGFREAFSGDMADKFFSSSSVHPNYGYNACVFNGYNGYVYYDNRYYSNDNGSARCVSAAGVN